MGKEAKTYQSASEFWKLVL